MKKIILFLAFIFYILPNSNGQTFASTNQYTNKESNKYSQLNFISNTSHASIGAASITGIAMAGIGTIALFGGFISYALNSGDNYRSNGTNNALMIGGAAMILTGGVLLIVGSEHNYIKKFGIVSPKKNEIGLAYNF